MVDCEKVDFEILKITIVEGQGPDWVILHTNLPNPIWPFNNRVSVKFEAMSGVGENYCRTHFPGVLITKIGK